MPDYWHRVLDSRLTRRRAIAATGATVASAAFLAACGGSDSKSSGGAEKKSSLLAANVDESKSARAGGKYVSSWPTPPTQDPHGAGPGQMTFSYTTLVRVAPGNNAKTDGTIEAYQLESWEVSPDKLTITGKMNPNIAFSPNKPVNGRAVDAEDVAASWKRFSTVSSRRGELANSVDPAAPIMSITAADPKTVIIKLKEPLATFLPLMTTGGQSYFTIVPKEAADQNLLDLRNMNAGSGPYYITELIPSSKTTWKRNPGHKADKRNMPWIEDIELVDLVEYAPNLAQLKSGNFPELLQGGVKAEDVLPLKNEQPLLEVRSKGLNTTYDRTLFGQKSDSPFRDERVRQAYVLTWDRDLFIDAAYSVAQFTKAGIDIERAYDCAIAATTYEGWWLDPKGKNFGANAKFFNHDIAEAKKLLSAAGFPNGLEHDLSYAAAPGLQAQFYQHAEPIIGMIRDSGIFKPKIKELNYAAEWNNIFRFNKGQFSGTALFLDSAAGEPANNLFMHYHTTGSQYFGGDSTLDDMTSKAQREFDEKKRKDLVHEIQRYEAGKLYQPRLGGATTLDVSWPALRNKWVWQGGPQPLFTTWLDTEKAPFKKA
jgi:peptide/nickel transport system substrate-binding protein